MLKGRSTMGRYRILLFDLDDTLLDFSKAEEEALRKLFANHRLEPTTKTKEHFKRFNELLWKAYEKGEAEIEELANIRFTVFFNEYGIEVDGIQMNKEYRNYLKENYYFIEGALELVKNLSHHFHLYIVTNGDVDTQMKRIQLSGLTPFSRRFFISERVGFPKPKKEFFDYVFLNIDGFKKEETILIGDSYHADVVGGSLAGIDTCWFNPRMKQREGDTQPAYEIRKLEELYNLL